MTQKTRTVVIHTDPNTQVATKKEIPSHLATNMQWMKSRNLSLQTPESNGTHQPPTPKAKEQIDKNDSTQTPAIPNEVRETAPRLINLYLKVSKQDGKRILFTDEAGNKLSLDFNGVEMKSLIPPEAASHPKKITKPKPKKKTIKKTTKK